MSGDRKSLRTRIEALEAARLPPRPPRAGLERLTVGELEELKQLLCAAGARSTANLGPDDQRRVEELLDDAAQRTDEDVAQLEAEVREARRRLEPGMLEAERARAGPSGIDWWKFGAAVSIAAARAVRSRQASST